MKIQGNHVEDRVFACTQQKPVLAIMSPVFAKLLQTTYQQPTQNIIAGTGIGLGE